VSPSIASILVATSTVDTASSSEALLEAELAEALGEPEEAPVALPAPNIRLIDLALDLLLAGGSSSAKEPELRLLEGGGHDPKNRGFTLQNVEVTLSGVVDPYLRGDAHVVLVIDEEGETVVELEEVYLTTLSLPGNLEVKAGQFFTAFGRLNPMHPHAWEFVDQPVVSTRLLGPDGLRSPGAQIAWLTPLPFFLELSVSAQNAQGETTPSFRFVEGESVAGRTLIDRPVRGAGDLLYLTRARASFDLGEEATVVIGGSGLFGPNASGRDTRTLIGGADLYLKWRPLANDKGWPFLALQAEGMVRRYDAAAILVTGEDGTELEIAPRDRIVDAGLYAQAVLGFYRPFTIAVRYDFAKGEPIAFDGYASEGDSLRDVRHRASAAVTFYPTEFSKVRAQYAYDRSSFLPGEDAHSAYVQAEITFGAHGAHTF
jgi:hypothetical protein